MLIEQVEIGNIPSDATVYALNYLVADTLRHVGD